MLCIFVQLVWEGRGGSHVGYGDGVEVSIADGWEPGGEGIPFKVYVSVVESEGGFGLEYVG